MGTFITRVRTKDYDTWRKAFDSNQAGRGNYGLSNARIYRLAEDGNEIIILLDAREMARAREFAISDSRKSAMESAGVLGKPTDYFID